MASARLSSLGLAAVMVVASAADTRAQQVTFRLPDNDPNTNSDVIRSAAYSPDGSLLAVGYGRFRGLLQESDPGQAVLWEARTGKWKTRFPARVEGVCSVAFSPDGKTLAVAEFAGALTVRDVANGRERLTIQAPAWLGGAIAFSPDGRRLAVGLSAGATKGVGPAGNDVLVWDAATGKLGMTLKGHNGWVLALAFSPDGTLLASGGADGVTKLWETSGGRERATLQSTTLRTRLRDVGSAWVQSVAFSPDGRTLATAAGAAVAPGRPEGSGEVMVWNTTDGHALKAPKGFEGMVSGVAFSPDGKLLAAAGNDGLIRFYEAPTCLMRGEFRGRAPIAFSPDGGELASVVADRTMASWKLPGILRP